MGVCPAPPPSRKGTFKTPWKRVCMFVEAHRRKKRRAQMAQVLQPTLNQKAPNFGISGSFGWGWFGVLTQLVKGHFPLVQFYPISPSGPGFVF